MDYIEYYSYLCNREKITLILSIMKINDVICKAEYVMSTVRGLRDEPQNVGPEDLVETLQNLDEVRRYLKVYLRDISDM